MVNSSITLTASMRSNLMSLKTIATQMDRTQNILSTGKKVNSAIDNASSYYQARSLTNRAGDLNSLLDAMGQGIQTIQAATEGLESATAYLEQMKSVAEQALTIQDNGNSGAAGVQLVDNSAELLNSGEGYIALGGNMTSEEVKNALLNAGEGDKFVLISDVTLDEKIDLQTVENVTINGGGHTLTGKALILGAGGVIENMTINSNPNDGIPVSCGINGLGTIKNVNINLEYSEDKLDGYIIMGGGTIENVNINTNNAVSYGIMGQEFDIKNVSMKLGDGSDCAVALFENNNKIENLSIDPQNEIDCGIYIKNGVLSGFDEYMQEMDEDGDGVVDAYFVSLEDVNKVYEQTKGNAAGGDGNTNLFKDNHKQYSSIMTQFDELVEDTSYQGVNLLTGGNLTVTFNESRSHELTVKGKDMRTEKLGLSTKNWQNKKDIEDALEELTTAMGKIRSFSAELGNNYAIIQTRQDFTDALVDVLETGADNLVLADMNEASAQYLMLQTRQQLATNSLSLASQSAQSILSLF